MSIQSRREFLKSFGAIFGAAAVAPIAVSQIASSGEGRLLSSIKALWARMPWVKPKTLTPKEETRLLNQVLFEKLASNDPQMSKGAIDAINDFTRMKMREDGFYRRIMPPVPITNEELDRPGAITIPFGTLPIDKYIRGPRYKIPVS